jgi:serine/threonine protein kinase
LRREIEALERLNHPVLVRLLRAAPDAERPHLVLEHIEGPRLSTLMRQYGMALEQLLPLALNVCSVLHYLAHERVVHLDVKPSNIIMGGDPRLIDLSIARRLDELGELTSPVGTDLWMAPEQRDVERFGEIGPASDIWGLGATLRAAMPERVPTPVGDAVAACLAPRPADRPTADELARELEPLVDALPAPRLGRFRPSPRRRHPHQEVHR